MNNEKVNSTWNEGDQLLQLAKDEMLKGDKDVVPYMACSSARNSIKKFLTGFLLKNGIELKGVLSIENLLEKCQAIDSEFKNLDINNMYCSNETHDANFCVYPEQVEKCIMLASKTKELVDNRKNWPLSKQIK